MSVYRTLDEREFRDLASRILFEDNHLLVFNKRAGEIVQGDKTGDEPVSETLKAFIAQRDAKPGQVFMGVPHRLDRPVSGICLFAKTSKALERLNAMFRSGEVHKTYWALCCGKPSPETAMLTDWMTRNERLNKSFIAKGPGGEAKEAKLKYTFLKSTDRYHLVEVELLTRLPHQGRPQVRRPPLQPRRRHLPPRPLHPLHPPGEEDRSLPGSAGTGLLERGVIAASVYAPGRLGTLLIAILSVSVTYKPTGSQPHRQVKGLARGSL